MAHHDLLQHLEHALRTLAPGALAVGYSGGMDSTVLLQALAQSSAALARGLRVLHIDHGLNPRSAEWEQHCRAEAARLDLPFSATRVQVITDAGHGIEDAARKARYVAFAGLLQTGEILVLAQHRDDQAETILLKLLRGAGPQGLGGMRAMRQCGKGYLWRPLLDLPRAALSAYAQAHGLRWIEDPSNADTRLARNYLRAEILPRLSAHWPEASRALAHSATWARQAADFIEAQAEQALGALRGPDPATLGWRGWLDLPQALRDAVLRQWLRELQLDEPAHFHVAELERQLRNAAPDRNPCVCWKDTDVRRYRDLIYAMPRVKAVPEDWHSAWDGTCLDLPGGGSLLLLDHAGIQVDGADLQVRLRKGGEKMRPADKPHTRELRLLLQEAGVPPWIRPRVPLIFANDELIAAGDLILSDTAIALCARLGACIAWHEPGGRRQLPAIDSVTPLR